MIMNLVEQSAAFGGGVWTNVANPAPALGDFNGDGFADLVIGGDTNVVWLWSSSGDFGAPGAPVATVQVSGSVAAFPTFVDRRMLLLKSDGGHGLRLVVWPLGWQGGVHAGTQ